MADEPQTLSDLLPTTPDLRAERLAELKRLFPDLFTDEGRLNPDELKRLVEPESVHQSERYEFKWYGKAASKREAFTPTTATLVYDPERSVNPDQADGNMIIEGENLETLKLLLSAYREQVKCIYIDPPYNTGKDFIYRDRYAEDRRRYWEQTGAAEEGIKLESNPETSGRYHSDWLSMIHPRLLVARSLLKRDGFIVASIDDAELHNLTRLFDDVFGEENRVAVLVWDKNRKNDAKLFSVGHEYMLVYAKDRQHLKDENTVLRLEKEGIEDVRDIFQFAKNRYGEDWEAIRNELLEFYKTIDETDPRKPITRFRKVDKNGPYRDDKDISWPGGGGPDYEIRHPKTQKPCKMPRRGWVFPTEEGFWDAYREGRVAFGPDEKTVPSLRTNLFEATEQVMRSVQFSYAQVASQQFDKIFGSRVFDNPKHFEDLRQIVEYLSSPGDVVLDFFAGSGSFAHAALLANKTAGDRPKRRFICVQIPEQIDSSETSGKNAVNLGLKTISAITIERVKRVIEGYGDDPQTIPDTGFRVFKLAKSTFPRCDFAPDPEKTDAENIETLRAYIAEKESVFRIDHSDDQVLFDEVLLKNGFQLHYTRTRRDDFPDNAVYDIDDGHRSAIVCLDWNRPLADSTLKRLGELAATASPTEATREKANEKPFFLCLERALNTTTKWNLAQMLGDHFTAY